MKKSYLDTPVSQALRRVLARNCQRSLAVLLGVSLTLGAQAQQRPVPGFFTDDAGARRAAGTSPLAAKLRSARSLTLNVAGLRAALATAPLEKRLSAKPLLVTLPLPDGTTGRFLVTEASVMAPELAAQFPSIKTYVGVGQDDPTASVRLDLTPQGFHAQVLSAVTGDFFLDPTTRTDTQHYLSFWKRDMPGQSFSCGVEGSTESSGPVRKAGSSALRTSGTTVRTFRLALAATGEYTAYQGGTVALGLAAMVTAVNRVVGVYERELDVRLVLVANNASLVYTDPNTDPYSNSSPSTLLTQNQANITTLIGAANYDIGHVFSTGGGGVAGLGVVCKDASKARGETGLTSPIGDAFYIDYVAHEMGHQFGGNHTFNSATGSCGGGNRSNAHAYEPGSGSTIMAYAGICGADDLQPHSDAYFHVESYEEIQTYLGTVSCGTSVASGNTAPTVVLPASGKVLPVGTPFKLTASGSDAEGDALTYNWEEYDRGTSAALTTAQVAGQTIPLFRSFNPTTSPTRYFPRLSDLVANTTTTSERLPTVTRPLNFRVTLRDEHNGPAGVVGGINSSATVSLNTTSAAGPFVVTAPNSTMAWTAGTNQTVTWDVAGTTGNGVNCATVNIRLSTDGGLTYPILLLAGTANDGSEAVAVPSEVATTTARIMVEAADNYFFDISDANFAITPQASLSVLYQTGDLGQPRDNVVRPYLQLVNNGATAVSYQQVTVRYWLTAENFAPLVTQIDWAQLGTSQVSARYVALPTPRQGAYGYVEYAFLAGAGSLAAASSSGPILTSAHKQTWTDFDETDDYSYAATSAYAPNDHITVYQNGLLVSGTEPAAIAAVTSLKVYAGNQDTAPTTSAISVYLQVGNSGTVPVNYSDLTVRYWFTPEGTQAVVAPIDYAVLGAANLALTTGQQGTQPYAELSFASSLGTFGPTTNTGNVQFRLRKADWSALDQSNDYSFRASAAVTEQPRITAYLKGQLVYGTEPTSTSAVVAATAARPVAGGATITTTVDNTLEGSPNPFTDQVQLRFTLVSAEAYTVTVYDMQGRLLEELPGGTASAGQPQQLTWQAGRYAAGLYLVRLRTASTEQHLKFIKQ